MIRAVGYIRVSTQGQLRDGYSLAYQRDKIIGYCGNNGIELVRIYEDKGISGAKVDGYGLTVERESKSVWREQGSEQECGKRNIS
jgi:hypothetical protein